MHVIATAGHVDHGKSTLVKALTGSDPDRLVDERRRGLSIELGYCWTRLAGVGDVAFVDVPGHERFVPTMLAGVGAVPAALLVVAADDPWMPQAAEHLAALDAVGVRHGVVAVTRTDLADPAPMAQRARKEIHTTSLRGSPVVAVSGTTGQGLDELRSALVEMVRSVESPPRDADVRLWVDRRFHVRGAGTVVTGTLPAGTVAVDDRLSTGAALLRVRGVQALGRPVESVSGPARVAVNVVGETAVSRGQPLTTPDAFLFTDVVDVRIRPTFGERRRPPEQALLHAGSAAVPVRYRPLAEDLGRLTLSQRLPLRVGDRGILRDPGSRAMWGATVLDPVPPSLRRRGSSTRRAAQLSASTGRPEVADELRRRGWVEAPLLRRIGVPASGDGWHVDPVVAEDLGRRLRTLVEEAGKQDGLSNGVPLETARARLGLPSTDLIRQVVAAPLRLVDGTIRLDGAGGLPAYVERGVAALAAELREHPFRAPTAGRLQELGLDARAVGAAHRAGLLLHLGDGVVLMPGAVAEATRRLRDLPQPFTTSEARVALATTRRVALPLLRRLDKCGTTRRMADDRRLLARTPGDEAT